MSEFVVCPDCRGHGTDSKQELVFTSDDLDEWYGDDSDERRQFIENYRTGAYSHPCRTCHGPIGPPRLAHHPCPAAITRPRSELFRLMVRAVSTGGAGR